MSRMFGTDGVRGVANKELTAEMAMQLGQAGAYVLSKDNGEKDRSLWWAVIPDSPEICLPMR